MSDTRARVKAMLHENFLNILSDADFQYISGLVYYYCGINLHQGKKELVRARLARRLRDLGLDSFAAYCRYLREPEAKEEVRRMLDVLSTNLTSFFRERGHFDFLQRELPRIIKGKGPGVRLRLWSTACSSGEEAYSLAIILADAISTLRRPDAKILATEISSIMLSRAVRGEYDSERMSPVPAAWCDKYFTRCGDLYVADAPLKNLIVFRRLNVTGLWPFKGLFDVIFCRNMMIYFDAATQASLVERFYRQLYPGGLLFVGHSESLLRISHKFVYLQPTVYQKPH